MINIFLDANILIDYIDVKRLRYSESRSVIGHAIRNDIQLLTSCDLITTVYYLLSKIDKNMALMEIKRINEFCEIIDFTNKEVETTCQLMLEDSDYEDLEDTIQYVLAKKMECDVIVSNDKSFVAKDMSVLTSQAFLDKYVKNGD